MPRRPSKKAKTAGKPRKINRSDARVNKWNNSSDIPMDEEDQFHASRDQILLDDEGEDDDGDIDDDEVFALQMDEEEDEEEEEEEESDAEDNDFQSGQVASQATKSKQKVSVKGKENRKKDTEESSEDDEEEEEESWGKGKAAYYSSNAAQIESDDEEALQLEEQEAKRLQTKARDDMNEEDFGLEDSIEAKVTSGPDNFEETSAPVIQPILKDKSSILRHLQKTDPESLALAGDWTDSASSLMKTKQKLEKLEAEKGSVNSFSLGMMHLHYQTLSTYTTVLAFYLHLRASQKYAQRPELLRTHPIMQRLLKLKQSLVTLEDLNFAVSDDEDEDEDEEDDDEDVDDVMQDARQLWDMEHDDEDEDEEFDSDELHDLLADARSLNNLNSTVQSKKPTSTSPPKKKRKTAPASGEPAIPSYDLIEPEFVSFKNTSMSSNSALGSADAFGEATSLQHADAVDKNARRKNLRFHTSRIESANARRSNARANALGGDDDIPYRERKKEKEERLAQEAKARVRTQGGADLDDAEPEPRNLEDGDGDEEMEDINGYYNLVKKQVKEKKERKKTEYEASRADRFVEEEVNNGPRSLTRAILANKGLTPHRSKSVRNPRVKKKLSFAKAQRKVASQKAVYKGGINVTGGRYEGEKTGISKVIKSVRLG
ncbi:Sas10 C-terminal domain-containing protein [Lentinula guzmanii]|uniref:Sas10 C-terminal domain-containing protein n=1 Tax=Lentinula guzmanii TaxID=2804957 RepID=A0AA38MSY2_9AGAR|nr:Sas10 C-terminal domain-containing protein [Lentinula guzmanii]